MKIISQDQNQISLKDRNISNIIIGTVFIIGGGYFAYYLYSTAGLSNGVWIAAAVFVVGLIVLFSSATISVTMDKSQGQILFQKKRLIGTTVKNYNIQDCLRVELRKSFHMNPGTRSANGMISGSTETMSYQSVVVMKDGSELPLENVKNKSGGSGLGGAVLMGGTGKELVMANQVANFLGIPFQEVGPGSAPTVIGSGMNGINL